MFLLVTIWIMTYGRHHDRLYVLKDPPTVVRQWNSEAACIADPAKLGMPNTSCVAVSRVPSCYNDGSTCVIFPMDDAGKRIAPLLVPIPK